jgi:hypothetical protein
MEKQEPEKTCTKCSGFGFWPIGDLVPIGKYDAQDWGNKVIQCPFCEAGYEINDKEGRYKYLLKIKNEEKTDKKTN